MAKQPKDTWTNQGESLEKRFVMSDSHVFIHWFNNDHQTIEKLLEIGLKRIAVSDAIIAATSVFYNIPLFTYNMKDFHFIPDIELI